ncbi:MAG: outer membrane beta-barrel protein [Candidatus Krumholzibacteriaceae bacterium]
MCRALILTVCLVLVGLSPLAAQPFELLDWGVYGGINAGYIHYASAVAGLNPGWGIGYTIGPFAEFSLMPGVRLQSGLRFDHFKNHSDLRVRLSGEIPAGTETGWGEFVLDRISVPVLAKVAIVGERRLFLIAGPELEYIRSAEARQELGGRESSYDMGIEVNRLNLALDAGLGMELRAGGHAVFMQAIYCHGLTNVSKWGYWLVDWQTRELAVTAGIMF